jgi:hypothetical protein
MLVVLLVGMCFLSAIVVRGTNFASAEGASRSRLDTIAATRYVRAQLIDARAVTSYVPAIEAAQRRFAARVAHNCGGVLAGAPENQIATKFSREIFSVQGVLRRTVTRPASARFVREVGSLQWGTRWVAEMINRVTVARARILGVPLPDICADARFWASTRFRALSRGTVRFLDALSPKAVADADEGQGTLNSSINAFVRKHENAQERRQSLDFERHMRHPDTADSTSAWVAIFDALGLTGTKSG